MYNCNLTFLNILFNVTDNNNSVIEIYIDDNIAYKGKCNPKIKIKHMCNRINFTHCTAKILVVEGSVSVGPVTTNNHFDRRTEIKINNEHATMSDIVSKEDLHLITHVYPWHYGWNFWLNTNDTITFTVVSPLITDAPLVKN